MTDRAMPYSRIRDTPPTFHEVMEEPHSGDILCFDGAEWRVARRDGRRYPVEDPQGGGI